MIRTPTAVFLDRDGTIIRDVRYLAKADDVELLPDAARAIGRLNRSGARVIVITNQSGIARGFFSEADYLRTQTRLGQLLATDGARIDATYFCPHHPDFSGACNCRKPGTGLVETAIAEHHLDMTTPAWIGDRWRDIVAYQTLGGLPVMVQSDNTPDEDLEQARNAGVPIAPSLGAAVDILLGKDPA